MGFGRVVVLAGMLLVVVKVLDQNLVEFLISQLSLQRCYLNLVGPPREIGVLPPSRIVSVRVWVPLILIF